MSSIVRTKVLIVWQTFVGVLKLQQFQQVHNKGMSLSIIVQLLKKLNLNSERCVSTLAATKHKYISWDFHENTTYRVQLSFVRRNQKAF